MSNELVRQSVYEAAAREEVRQAVQQVYQALEQEIALRRPVCQLSGRCCRFEEFGHRLFLTTMELAAFVHDLKQAGAPRPAATWDGRGCPFQVGKLCGVHGIRPFGCRMFFCDPTATEWQNQQYERFHSQLKRFHETLGVPYFYLEWREALRTVLPDELAIT